MVTTRATKPKGPQSLDDQEKQICSGFPFLGACAESQQKREPETYFLPEDYVGAFYIVFNVADEEPVRRLDGARVYEIPENGVLLTQGNTNEGVVEGSKIRFYRQSDNGEKVEINDRWTTSIGDEEDAREDFTF